MMKDYNQENDDRLYEDSYGGILLKQHSNLFAEEKKEDIISDYDMESVYSNKTTESVASIFQSNADFYHTMDGKKNKTKVYDAASVAPTEDILESTSSILLLDLRDVEDYKRAHIKGAISFPSPNIKRDKFTKAIWMYKNKEDRIIIIYHEDEKKVIDAAELMVEKGFQNIYILSNGFDLFAEDSLGFFGGKISFIEGTGAYVNNNMETSTYNSKKQVKSLVDCPYL
mmetsp:Transcript_28606/g.25317  ORF Transcript_28606/g.25317 Transcript_28606/m.25317 type:complete len:227 (+) Transcript_28606:236-916(+)